MSLLTDNVIPGEHGKVFGTDAKEDSELKAIRENLLKLDGITEVQLNNSIFPREFTVLTNKVISIDEIEKRVKSIGFHAIPKQVI
ncbi:heavy-metal-associated domain-containing protein [Flavobacterium sp. ARAG 55.4]|uniref:Heavy-metal-associated domain-containing protein n=1 Tax=Flavobacterium plantiphilum TaxID=3163297 RepID=A0ABW8XVZ3_9FLAO